MPHAQELESSSHSNRAKERFIILYSLDESSLRRWFRFLVAFHLELLEAVLLFLSLSPSLEGLNIALVVGSDAISDGRKGTRSKEGGIAVGLGVLQEPRGQTVVVVSLLDCVVPGGKGKVFLPVGNQKLFEFCKGK